MEEDPNQNCRNYPNSDFQSYKACDDELSKNHLANKTPGIVPVWLTDDIESVTTNAILDTGLINFKVEHCLICKSAVYQQF